MENYQAPHVAVRQQFTPAAPAVGVPQLIPGVFGPAFSVYEQAGLGSVDGINNANDKLAWLGNALLERPVYDNTHFSSRIYDRFTVRVYLKAWGERITRLLDSAFYTKDATGIAFSGTPRFVVGSDVNGANGVRGTVSGFMPYASGTLTTALGATDKILIDTAADFINAKIQPGQTVHIDVGAGVDVATTVKRVKSATELELDTAVGVALISGEYTVGSDAFDGLVMEDFFDLSAAFLKNNVQVGDVLSVYSNQGLGNLGAEAPATASIKQILNDTWLKVCIVPVDERDTFDITQLDTLTGDSGLTPVTQTTAEYAVERYYYRGLEKGVVVIKGLTYTAAGTKITVPTGFAALVTTKNLEIKNVHTGRLSQFASKVTASGADIVLANTGNLEDGDECEVWCQVAPANAVGADKTKVTVPASGVGVTLDKNVKTNDLALITYADATKQTVSIVTATQVGANLEITLAGAGMNKADGTLITSIEFFSNDWTYTADAFVTYRAAKFVLAGQAFQYNSVDDISSIVGDLTASDQGINEYNDVAYAALLAYNASGGKSGLIFPTDGSGQNEAVEYADARAKAEMLEVYAQAFCTDNPDVNAAAGPYCTAQSEPYAAHERVAYVAYRWEDIMFVANGTPSAIGTGILTDSTARFIDDGVAIKDTVEVTDADGVIKTYSVKAIISNNQLVLSDGTASIATTDSYIISKGNKTAQANVIKAISESLTERRLTHVWTGDFSVEDARFGARVLPGFFACAAMAGWNAAVSPSQGFTNSAIPGFIATPRFSSNWFRKEELDIIGGGGTLILTQASAGAGLVCRHQLTTDDSSDKTGEDSVRRQVDVAAKVTRSTYSIYTGKSNIDDDFISFLGTEVWDGILTTLKNRKIIRDMKLLEMKQNPNKLTGVISKVKVTPYYPLNDMDITLIV